MDRFARLDPADRKPFFEETAGRMGLGPEAIEKDFWVVWTLRELFRLEATSNHLTFKGGTSLSKIYGVIERFSEDIDVSIDREFLGFGGDRDPERGGSNKEKERRLTALQEECQRFVGAPLRTALADSIAARLPGVERWTLDLDEADRDRQTLLFGYPSSWRREGAYVRPVVRIELGARADHWPVESGRVSPYVADTFPSEFEESSCSVKVLTVDRTFWEKATLLHAEHHRPVGRKPPVRLSRHYYDVFCMIRGGVAARALDRLDLLDRVAEHKAVFFKSSWARYDIARQGTLRLAPADERRRELERDYARMREMFFRDPPPFEEILGALEGWQEQFNRGEAPVGT